MSCRLLSLGSGGGGDGPLGCYKGDTPGTILFGMGHIPEVEFQERCQARPGSCFHDVQKTGAIMPVQRGGPSSDIMSSKSSHPLSTEPENAALIKILSHL